MPKITGALLVQRPRNRDARPWLMPVANEDQLEYLSDVLDRLARMENRDCGEGCKYVAPYRKPAWRKQSFFPSAGGDVRIERVLTDKGSVRSQ